MANQVHRTQNRRPEGNQAHTKVAHSRDLRGRRMAASEEGEWRASEEGHPQGAVISPLLANIYLHHVFDLYGRISGDAAMPQAMWSWSDTQMT